MTRLGIAGRAPGGESVRGLAGRIGGLAAGLLALGALALLLSQAGRWPGPAGDAIRENAAADRDATALFYTEVDGWPAWADRARNSAAARSRASRSPTSTAVSPARYAKSASR